MIVDEPNEKHEYVIYVWLTPNNSPNPKSLSGVESPLVAAESIQYQMFKKGKNNILSDKMSLKTNIFQGVWHFNLHKLSRVYES